jgi:hypothetical protein
MTHTTLAGNVYHGPRPFSPRGDIMAWSIFQQGGGQGAAVTWAKDFLSALGVSQSPANVQFVYDWEVSEGGGGKYNPLNQGPVPGQPQLTTTGSQYGGGAADFASYQAGITGAVDYLNMPAYSGVLAALKSSNYKAAEQALWASPWAASHYGYGASWSTATPPGAQPLAGGTAPDGTSTTGLTIPGIGSLSPSSIASGLLGGIASAFGVGSIKDMMERLGLIILGFALVIVGIRILSTGSGKQAINITMPNSSSKSGSSKEQVTSAKRGAESGAMKTGAEEAVEAAAAALCHMPSERTRMDHSEL